MRPAPVGQDRRVRVSVRASDAISHAGITRYFESRPGVEVLSDDAPRDAEVVVFAPERFTPQLLSDLRRQARQSSEPIVLLTDKVGEVDLLAAVACRVMAVLPRSAASDERLLRCVLGVAAARDAIPTDLVGELVAHLERLRSEGLISHDTEAAGLTSREVDVLRMMSEGLGTADIAREMCYSERTVKNIIYALTGRLSLRSRSHAVAYAVRAGVI